jgi:hypothetical protein
MVRSRRRGRGGLGNGTVVELERFKPLACIAADKPCVRCAVDATPLVVLL